MPRPLMRDGARGRSTACAMQKGYSLVSKMVLDGIAMRFYDSGNPTLDTGQRLGIAPQPRDTMRRQSISHLDRRTAIHALGVTASGV